MAAGKGMLVVIPVYNEKSIDRVKGLLMLGDA